MLQQLTYFSKAVILMSDQALFEILEQCRRQNKVSEITGMLLYVETHLYGNLQGRFIQVIEGPAAAIKNTFANIQLDNRHRNITILNHREIPRRDFADWSMGFEAIRDERSITAEGHFLLDDNFYRLDQRSYLNIPLNYLKSFYSLRGFGS